MDAPPRVIFEPLHPDVVVPSRATEGAVGYDVRAYLRGRRIEAYRGLTAVALAPVEDALTIEPGVRAAIPLGFRAALPLGMEAQLRLRSSIAFRRGLVMPNAPATIDPDYPGEWMVLVTNTLSESVEIQHQERIAQIVFAMVACPGLVAGQVVVTTDRGGGFGSTGRFEAAPGRSSESGSR